MRYVLALWLIAAGQSVSAHPQAIPPGTSLRADQIGHAFDGLCSGSQPLLLVERAQPVAEGAFAMVPDADNSEARAVWTSADGDLVLTIEASALQGSCTLRVPSSVSGDGAEVRQSLEDHLPRRARAATPEMIEGGAIWRWERGSTRREISIMTTPEGHALRYSLEH